MSFSARVWHRGPSRTGTTPVRRSADGITGCGERLDQASIRTMDDLGLSTAQIAFYFGVDTPRVLEVRHPKPLGAPMPAHAATLPTSRKDRP